MLRTYGTKPTLRCSKYFYPDFNYIFLSGTENPSVMQRSVCPLQWTPCSSNTIKQGSEELDMFKIYIFVGIIVGNHFKKIVNQHLKNKQQNCLQICCIGAMKKLI